ncbi:hypothetical protein [Natronobacillus azotifigens]
MKLQINIRNITINSMNALGSINVGKVFFAENRSSSIQVPKSDYEENELDEDKLLEMVPSMSSVPTATEE